MDNTLFILLAVGIIILAKIADDINIIKDEVWVIRSNQPPLDDTTDVKKM